MIRRFKKYIETSDWDEILIDGDEKLKLFCIVAAMTALFYFGGWALRSLWG